MISYVLNSYIFPLLLFRLKNLKEDFVEIKQGEILKNMLAGSKTEGVAS